MNKIKVCEVCGKIARGGVEAYVFNYIHSNENFDFTFVFFENPEYELPEYITKSNIKIVYVPSIKHLSAYKKALNTLFKENNFDIVHCHLNTLSGFALYEAKKCGVKVRISHSHSISSKNEPLRNIFKLALRHHSYKYATHYFAITKGAALFQFGKKNFQDVNIVPPYVDLDKFNFNQTKRDELRIKYGFNPSDFVLGNIGRLCVTKNQMFLIDILSKLTKISPNYKLFIIGGGELKEKINQKISLYKLEKYVTIIEPINNVEDYYNIFDLFVFPSLYEGYGLVIPESQANGLSFISSDRIPMSSFENYNGIFLPLDLDKWVDAITKSKGRDNQNIDFVDSSISNKSRLLDEYLKILQK